MAWLVTHMWAVLAGAGVLGLLFGWAVRGMLLKGKATKAQVERDVAQTELEQARSEIDGLYAAQRSNGASATVVATDIAAEGDASKYAAELQARETKLAELTQQLADSKEQLAKLQSEGSNGASNVASTVAAGVVGAAGGAIATQVAVAQDEEPTLVWRNRHLESRVRTLEAKIHEMGSASAVETSDVAAAAIGAVAGGAAVSAVTSDAVIDIDPVELDKLRFKNGELQQRLVALEDQMVAQIDETVAVVEVDDSVVTADADGENPEEELARLRWRNRYLEGRLAYYEGDEEGAEDAVATAGTIEETTEIADEDDNAVGGIIAGAGGAVGAGILGAMALAGDAAGDAVESVEDVASDAVSVASDVVEDVSETAEGVADLAMDAVTETVSDTVDVVEDVAGDAVDSVTDLADTGMETIADTATDVTAEISEVAETVGDAVTTDVEDITDDISVSDITSGLKDMVTDNDQNLIAGTLTGEVADFDADVAEEVEEAIDAVVDEIETQPADLPSMDEVDAEMADTPEDEAVISIDEASMPDEDIDAAPATEAETETEADADIDTQTIAAAVAMTQPLRLDGPVSGQPDDLTVIGGVGPKIQEVLNGLGIYHYDQIAEWSAENVAWVDDYMNFSGRIGREDWVAQAKVLAGADADA